jgi:hypothetical protein
MVSLASFPHPNPAPVDFALFAHSFDCIADSCFDYFRPTLLSYPTLLLLVYLRRNEHFLVRDTDQDLTA